MATTDLSRTLRFDDPARERRYRDDYLATNLVHIRWSLGIGLLLFAAFGAMAWLLVDDATVDLALRFGIGVPAGAAALAASYRPWFRRWWQPAVAGACLACTLAIVLSWAMVPGLPFSWGYVGSLCILAYAYSFSRIDYVWALAVGAGTAAIYTGVAIEEGTPGVPLLYANAFILVFIVLGVATAYMLERSSRQLFAQGEELAAERERADALLRNTFPEPVIDRLKSGEDRIADAIDAVSVLFADLVGFTGRAATLSPEELVAILDDLFGRLDEIVAAHGLEKIKTIGDAYMAVGGAPMPVRDHAGAAAEAALAMHALAGGRTWPGGAPMRLRIGIASGPAVAGVIGRERFAYDLWGDTVNLASRLQVQAEPGETMVAPATAALLDTRYALGEERIVDLKGKGPTAVRTLEGRR